MEVQHWDSSADGELNERNMVAKLKSLGYLVSRYSYPPGTYFPDHSHPVDKIDAVLAGRFRMTMSGWSVVLERGDTLFVPRGCVHSAEVLGGESVVSLDAVRQE